MSTCEHGLTIGGTHLHLTLPWAGGVSLCKCCQKSFGWIESHCSNFTTGHYQSNTWQPKDLCGVCGGKYVYLDTTAKEPT